MLMFRFVATCMVTVAKKIKQCGAGGLLGSKHQGHNVSSNSLVFDAIAISQVSEAERKHYHTTYHQLYFNCNGITFPMFFSSA